MEKGIIVPLNESNYPTWKLQVKMLLIKEGLHGFVNGTEIEPNATEADALTKYRARKDKALAFIVLAIDPKLLYLISDPKDPAVVWTMLSDTFQKKSWSNKLRLRKKLYSMRLKNDGSLQDYLKTCVELFNEMAVIGDALSEEDKVISLLASLPDKYSVLVTALEAQDSVPSWEVVQERLLHEEAKKNGEGPSQPSHSQNSDTSALFSGNGRKVFQQKQNKRYIKCFNCGKEGHMKKDCRMLKYQKANKPNKSESVNVTHSQPNNDSNITLLAGAFTSVDEIEKNAFIIDSGATQHMCCSNENMINYEMLSTPVSVQIGDGRVLKGVGTGCINIKTSLPNNEIKNICLQDVLHVPELSFNLISVSKASANGRRVIFTDDACRIFSSSNDLIGLGKKSNKLYFLECDINFACTSRANVANNNYLWHQ